MKRMGVKQGLEGWPGPCEDGAVSWEWLRLSCELKACWKVDGQEGQPWGLAVIRAESRTKARV